MPVNQYLQQEAPFFYLRLDGDGVVREANRFTLALLGAVVGKGFQQVFVDFSGTLDLTALARNSEEVHRLGVSTTAGLPQTIWCRFHPAVDGLLAVGHVDISEMQRLQREFLELNNELNAATRELQKTNAQLQKLNELKNKFVGFAAHDLRRPIGVIQSYTELLQTEADDRLTQEHREFLEIIADRAKAMNRLLEDLLDIAMIESGRNEARLQATDLAEIFRTVELKLQPATAAKAVRLVMELDPALPCLALDALKIEQAVLNLADNAVAHTRPGSSVRIAARRTGGEAVISVSDNGPGITAAAMNDLFHPFASERTPASGRESHGLGLAIAKRMVEAHRGRIWAESKPGEGATFFFTLPLPAVMPQRA